MTTLYRKYRPTTFSEVLGQNHIKVTLQNEISKGKISHAYLFCGPRAVGKTTLARLFAKTINCHNLDASKADPCNQCEVCQSINLGKNLDIIEIDAASQTGVDNVRENIIANARIAPSQAKFKVFIIDEVHMLSVQAFNALLKLIEEPPQFIVFILCTTEIHKVPQTIISRCQRFDFRRISLADIVKKLAFIAKQEGITVEDGILEEIARHSEGHMRDAESLFGQVVAVGGQHITKEEAELVLPKSHWQEVFKTINFLAGRDAAGAIEIINGLLSGGVDLKLFAQDILEILRKIMLTKLNPELANQWGIELGNEAEQQIIQLSKDLELEDLIFMLEKLNEAIPRLKNTFIIQLPLETAIIEICLKLGADQKKSDIKPKAPKTTTTDNPHPQKPSTSHQHILERWPEFLARIKKYNHSLAFVLKVCEPRSLNNNKLCLAFKYKLHKNRLDDINIKKIVEKVLQEVYGQELTVEAIIDENLALAHNTSAPRENNSPEEQPQEEQPQSDIIDNLLKTFGGRIVE